MRHEESIIQRQCVAWFRMQYPKYAMLLFAVGNGGVRSKTEAAIMKGEGVTAGVSDLILLKSNGTYASLCIEMKTAKGVLNPNQKQWSSEVEKHGNKYVVCRSLDQFRAEVYNYLNLCKNFDL